MRVSGCMYDVMVFKLGMRVHICRRRVSDVCMKCAFWATRVASLHVFTAFQEQKMLEMLQLSMSSQAKDLPLLTKAALLMLDADFAGTAPLLNGLAPDGSGSGRIWMSVQQPQVCHGWVQWVGMVLVLH